MSIFGFKSLNPKNQNPTVGAKWRGPPLPSGQEHHLLTGMPGEMTGEIHCRICSNPPAAITWQYERNGQLT